MASSKVLVGKGRSIPNAIANAAFLASFGRNSMAAQKVRGHKYFVNSPVELRSAIVSLESEYFWFSFSFLRSQKLARMLHLPAYHFNF